MTNPLICLDHIKKQYVMGTQVTTVLHDISLNINAGELLAIVGASGSGKSTLMNLIGLLDRADSGTYQLHGQDVSRLNQDELATLRNQQIGFVFQQFHLLPRFSAAQNVALPLTYREMARSQIKQRVDAALARVGMLAYAHHRPSQLSGGQQQRVAIARALIGEPQVILADEPTGALDSQTGRDIMKLFLALHQEGRTILMVTHDERVAAQCTRNIILADGSIVSEHIICN